MLSREQLHQQPVRRGWAVDCECNAVALVHRVRATHPNRSHSSQVPQRYSLETSADVLAAVAEVGAAGWALLLDAAVAAAASAVVSAATRAVSAADTTALALFF